ncbi:hypothetical protein [Sorangium cellulosum]|nr:hypothetical protein [Sorangium cellulosum]
MNTRQRGVRMARQRAVLSPGAGLAPAAPGGCEARAGGAAAGS